LTALTYKKVKRYRY